MRNLRLVALLALFPVALSAQPATVIIVRHAEKASQTERDPVLSDAPAFDPLKQSADAQRKQFGYNNDFLGYFPMPGAANPSAHGLHVVNHEFTHEELMGQPHNLILQILLDWGLAGFACIIVIAFYYVRRAWPELRSRGEELAAPFMGAVSLLLLSMLDAALFHVLPVAIFAACAGMMAARTRSDERGRPASGP
jgi:hypothetical protein